MKEIIFPIRQDGVKTRAYAGTSYLVNATSIAGMPYASTSDSWKCLFARVDLVKKFFPNGDIPKADKADLVANADRDKIIAKDKEKKFSTADVIAQAKDDRALFYMGIGGCDDKVRTLTPGDAITSPLNSSGDAVVYHLRGCCSTLR